MANCTIFFNCAQQYLERTDSSVVAADAANTVAAHFTLCSKWQGLDVHARFQHMAAVYDVRLEDGEAVIPWEVLKPSGFSVSLFGEDAEGGRLTSSRVFVEVEQSINIDGAEPIPSTPSLLQRFYGDVEATKEIAQSVRDDADAGSFDGATFTPSVSSDGVISWSNDKGLDNPQSVSVKGPKGDTGAKGAGVPDGGDTGQVIRKVGDTTEWADANDHEHAAEDITSGTLKAAQLPTVPVSKGGTGATDSKGATYNLLNGCKMEELTETTPEGNVKFYMRPYSSESSNGGIFAATLGSLFTWIKPRIRSALGFSDDTVLAVENGGTGADSAADAAASLQVESIGGRTALAYAANLNNITEVGSYVCATDNDANSLSNSPVAVAFTLTVKSKDGDAEGTAKTQELITADEGNRFYRSTDSAGTWGAWTNDAIMATAAVSLPVSGWENLAQTVSVEGVTESNNIIVSPAPNSAAVYCGAGVRAVSQQDGGITFNCNVVPDSDVYAVVLILS